MKASWLAMDELMCALAIIVRERESHMKPGDITRRAPLEMHVMRALDYLENPDLIYTDRKPHRVVQACVCEVRYRRTSTKRKRGYRRPERSRQCMAPGVVRVGPIVYCQEHANRKGIKVP